MTTSTDALRELESRIMNLPAPDYTGLLASPDYAAKIGHRDARHAAAELVVAALAALAQAEQVAQTVAPILKGVGRINGDGWKDTTHIGEVIYVWNTEMPAPYAAGQYPRMGSDCGWTASRDQYDFAPATVKEVQQCFADLLARDKERTLQGVKEQRAQMLAAFPPTAQPAQAQARDAEQWRALYRRAINEANGLTNYVEDRPELHRAERNLILIEAEALALRAAIDEALGEPAQ